NDSPAAFWQSVASSADGSKLVAAAYNGALWISTNAGVNWMANSSNTGNQPWSCVASSADGTKLVAGTNNGQLPSHGQIWTWQPNKTNTTSGTTGSLAGGRATATELQYIG